MRTRKIALGVVLCLLLWLASAATILAKRASVSPPAADERAARQATCLANIRQLGIAMLMYANDWNERLPPAERWSDATRPYRRTDDILRCPEDKAKYSYAMNYNTSKACQALIDDPSRTALLFESTQGRKNACDAGTSWPKSLRHPAGNCVAFANGHAQCLSKKPDLRLNPKPIK